MDLSDAITYHQLALAAAGRSPATTRLYLTYELRFLEYLREHKLPPALDQLNPLNVRQAVLWFQRRQVGKRKGEVATSMLLNVLKTWSSFLEQEGVFVDSPLRRVKRVKVRKLERQPYTRAEVNAMLHACDCSRQPERDRLLVLLLLDSDGREAPHRRALGSMNAPKLRTRRRSLRRVSPRMCRGADTRHGR